MIYFTPGPSQLYPTVKQNILQALREDIPSLSHRSDKFRDIVKSINKSLRTLLSIPENYSIFLTASATEAMERIIENCVAEQSFHFVNGIFANRFYQVALDLKKNSLSASVKLGEIFDFENINIPADIELIALTHNETSSGISIPPSEIYKLAKKYPEALIAVDIVSSVPHVNLDYKKLDCVFFSVQKGFGLPAGLGLLIVSPRALRKADALQKRGYSTGSYHKFQTLYEYGLKNQTIETPNVLGIYLLDTVLQDMLKAGIRNLRKQTKAKAAYLYNYFDRHNIYKPFVQDKKFRSDTVIVISTPNGSKSLLARLKKQGLIVGAGYGEMKEKQIRIANFPAHSIENMKKLLRNIP